MPLDFFSFAPEIRIKVYEELLVVPNPIVIETTLDSSRRPYMMWDDILPSAEILRVNRRAYREASPLLYSENRFQFGMDIADTPRAYDIERIIFASFLDQIGPQNARSLHSLLVAFPAYSQLGSGDGAPRQEGIFTTTLIQDRCAGITTLEAVLHIKVTAETLEVVHGQFSSLPSLREVIVFLYDELLSDELCEMMLRWGWAVKLTEREESLDDREGDYPDYMYDFGHDDEDYEVVRARHTHGLFFDSY